jgi:asparagine synthase (glutamine-hydrolysing)
MLDGQGGDESLLGYERYYPSFFFSLASRAKIITLLKEFYLSTKKSKLKLLQIISYTLYFLVWRLRRRFLSNRIKFLKTEILQDGLRRIKVMNDSFFRIREMQINDIMRYNLPQLLRYEDRSSMAHSIEARVPYIEHRCIEVAVALSPENKIRKGYTKYPLRELASKVLPSSIAWRTNKMGFEAPEELWLEKHLSIMEAEVQHSALLKSICNDIPRMNKLPSGMRWKLYNVALWERMFNVSH